MESWHASKRREIEDGERPVLVLSIDMKSNTAPLGLEALSVEKRFIQFTFGG